VLAFAALADDVRLGIVEALADGDRSVNELVDLFPISQPAVSRHLRLLRDAGLVTVRQDAQRRIYALDVTALDDIEAWARQHRAAWERRLDDLGRHLDRMASDRRKRR
jgi:DNA-binding transcriptional ArsR family regulator